MIDNTKNERLIEAVESKGEGIVIPMLDPKDLQIKASAVVPPTYIDAIECHRRWSDRFNKQCAEVVEQHKDVLDFEDKDRFEGNKPVTAEKPVEVKDQKLTESTHAAVAKPEGDRIKSFNNALKYAKRDGVPYCYGYTNGRLKKFFAFDQPFKWDGDDAAFKAQYKNASTIYVAHPDKGFIKESLTEDYLKNRKNPEYWQHQVDYHIEKFGRVGGGLIQDLDEAGFYLDANNKVQPIKPTEPKEECLAEDTIKQADGKWVNKGDEGTHGEFKTKKEADAQRKAMYANGYKENLTEATEEPSEEGVELEPEAKVKIAFEKFKPWGNAVNPYNQVVEAGKLEDFEKTIEQMYPDGIEDAELNDLLTDVEWLSAVLGMKFKVEG